MKTHYASGQRREGRSDNGPVPQRKNTTDTTRQSPAPGAAEARARAGRGFRSRSYFLVPALLLIISLWPASLTFPTCINWWYSREIKVTINPFPGWGSTLGLADGRLFLLHGRLVSNPTAKQGGGPNSFHNDLSDWWGNFMYGMGTRRSGYTLNEQQLEQCGAILPVWPLSTGAAVLLGVAWIRANRRRRLF